MDGNANLYTLFEQVAARRGNAVLLETPAGRTIRYGELDALTGRIVNALRALGLAPGDRLAVQVEKSPENLLLYLAALRAGLVYLPLNTAYTLSELDYFVADAEPKLAIVDPSKVAALAERPVARGLRVEGLDAAGVGSFAELVAAQPMAAATAVVEAADLAAICYTSGTTGRAKGAMLSHRNLASNASTLREIWGFAATDRLLHALPLYHVHGLFVATNTALLAGATLLFLRHFEREAAFAALVGTAATAGATVMMGVPTFYTRLLAEPGLNAEAVAGIRLFISGSAPLLEQTFEAFAARTGHRVLERYGMTETGMNTSNPLAGQRRPGTVGLPLPDVAVRLGAGDGRVGELEVKGPNVFAGYWRMPEATVAGFTADGFFKTGDIALLEDDGYVRLVGRAKDLIITGGLNVYPKEVEALLDAFPEIGESAVIGVPHPDFGEAVVAVVTPAGESALPAEAELLARLGEEIAAFKRPKRLLPIDALPRNAMGKVQKNLLRERFAGLFS